MQVGGEKGVGKSSVGTGWMDLRPRRREGTHNNPGPVVDQFANVLLHVPVLLLQLRQAACKLFLEAINRGPVSSWPIVLSLPAQILSHLRLSR